MAYLKTFIFLALVLQLVNCQNGRAGRPDTPLKAAKEGEYPHQVQLRNSKTKDHICGGAILNTYVVLTSALCVYSQIQYGTVDQIEVVAGEYDLRKKSGHEQVVHIHEAIVHKNYGRGAMVDSIALLVLRPELKFNEFVQSIPIRKNVSLPEKAVLSGWGRKYSGSTKNVNVLHHINLTIYDPMKCNAEWEMQLKRENRSRDIDMRKVLCARHTGEVKGRVITKMTACNGDTGSPLTCIDGTNFLCGISTGSDATCGQRGNTSGLFANILSHFDWITNNSNQLELRYSLSNCPCNYFPCFNEFCVNPNSLNNGIDDCGDGLLRSRWISLSAKKSRRY